eukprot:m.248759 g.248759  ORF g.248759 m.248759 type:complete len:398 (-) comp15421_c0_seq2:486-1679(-)
MPSHATLAAVLCGLLLGTLTHIEPVRCAPFHNTPPSTSSPSTTATTTEPGPSQCALDASAALHHVLKQMASYDLEVARDRVRGVPPLDAPPRSKFAYYKTHKTASTSTGAVFYRHARRNNLPISNLPHVVGKKRIHLMAEDSAKPPSSVVLNHLTRQGVDMTPELFVASLKFYESLLGTEDFAFVGNIRHPIKHLLSFYGYYVEPLEKQTWDQFLANPLFDNLMAREFGVGNVSDIPRVMDQVGDRMEFMVVEHIYESLALFALRNSWPLSHLIVFHALKRTDNSVRWDGKILKKSKPFDEFSALHQAKMKAKVEVDAALYKVALRQLKERSQEYRDLVERGAELVKHAGHALSQLCACDGLDRQTSEVCKWYDWTDLEYEVNLQADVPISPLIPIT